MASLPRLFCLFLLCLLPRPTHASVKCNQNLLATFKLRGLEYSANNRMQICPFVDNRCCTLMDEVRIIQLWKQFGEQQTKGFAGKAIQVIQNFYELFPIYRRIRTSDMVFHYLSFNRVTPIRHVCSENTHVQTLRRWGKFMELQRMFPGLGRVRRAGHKNRYAYLIKTLKNLLISETEELLSLTAEERLLRLKEPAGEKPISPKAKKELRTLVDTPMKKFMAAQGDFTTAFKEFQKKSEGMDRVIHHIPKKLTKSVNKGDRKLTDAKSAQNSKSAAAVPQIPGKKPKSVTRLGRALQNIVIFVPTGTSYLNSFRFITRMRVPYIPINTEIPMLSCRNVPHSFLKPFLVLNEDKYNFCHQAVARLRAMDPLPVIRSLQTYKVTLTNMLELKKSLYCSICDATQQRLFDEGRGLVVYSQEFCFDLLTKYKEYLLFKNIEFVEFVDSLLQVQECAQSTGDEIDFPKINRFSWMKRRIPFIRRCYEHLDTPNFYIYCRFMCVQYRIQDYSNFFEADIRTMETVYGSLMSFVRARRIRRSFDREPHELRPPTPGNATLSAEQANLDEEEQQLNVFQSNKTEFSLSESYIKGEIFEKIKKPLSVSRLRSLFVENVHGLNPISVYSLIDFRVGIQDILVEQAKRTEGEEIEVNALQGYFDAKNNMIRDFNNNIDLEFKETIERTTEAERQKLEVIRKKKQKLAQGVKTDAQIPDQGVPVQPPDWNQDFSPLQQPDPVSHWFNFFFH